MPQLSAPEPNVSSSVSAQPAPPAVDEKKQRSAMMMQKMQRGKSGRKVGAQLRLEKGGGLATPRGRPPVEPVPEPPAPPPVETAPAAVEPPAPASPVAVPTGVAPTDEPAEGPYRVNIEMSPSMGVEQLLVRVELEKAVVSTAAITVAAGP